MEELFFGAWDNGEEHYSSHYIATKHIRQPPVDGWRNKPPHIVVFYILLRGDESAQK